MLVEDSEEEAEEEKVDKFDITTLMDRTVVPDTYDEEESRTKNLTKKRKTEKNTTGGTSITTSKGGLDIISQLMELPHCRSCTCLARSKDQAIQT